MLSKFLKLLQVIIILTLFAVPSFGDDAQYFSYDEFISNVKSGKIVSVHLGEFSEIRGTYREGEEIKQFTTYHEDPNNDALLLDLLRQKDVKIGIKEREEGIEYWPVMSTLMILVPILILLLVIRLNRKITKLNRALETKDT